MDRKNASFHRPITTSQSGPLRVCQHEGHCPTHLRYISRLCVHKESRGAALMQDIFADASGLKEPENVRDSQEKVVQALQHYTSAQYSDMPSKFAELLLRMPELHRVCQVINYYNL